LDRSQVPHIKKAKKKALEEFKDKLEAKTGQPVSLAQAKKKIHNLKADIKSKADLNKTGNKKLKLKGWEKDFLQMIGAEENPIFSKIPGMLYI